MGCLSFTQEKGSHFLFLKGQLNPQLTFFPYCITCILSAVVKNTPVNAGDVQDAGLIPGLERFPGGGHDNPLQYSCLGNPMDRGAWWTTVHGVTKSQTQMKQLSRHIRALLGRCRNFDLQNFHYFGL